MGTYYPPVSFRFSVRFAAVERDLDSSFSEVTGLESERAVFEIREGGENRFTHRVPDRVKFENLVLKRGVVVGSGLVKWLKTFMEGDNARPFETKALTVAMLDADGDPLMSWNVVRAWPCKWRLSGLGADKNELAFETLELAYSYFTRSDHVPASALMLAGT